MNKKKLRSSLNRMINYKENWHKELDEKTSSFRLLRDHRTAGEQFKPNPHIDHSVHPE